MATLYRKYRPQTFGELVGQDHIRLTLQAALGQGRLGHAYLFAGPRGVGKTTVARLLAKTINCAESPFGGTTPVTDVQTIEPCNQCQFCLEITEGRSLDVIEIDAASNRGIDDIRDLREKIKFVPNQARAKVFIIDEVHMLTKEAFNALLKTLEEPPAHARFVLATTELHKVPVTIASRCQVFMFKKASHDNTLARLKVVAEQEGLTIDDAALAFLAKMGSGSYRDALSILDQVSSYQAERLTLESVQEILGLAREEHLLAFLDALAGGQRQTALTLLHDMEEQGIDLDHFAGQLTDAGRLLLHHQVGVAFDTDFMTDTVRWQALAAAWTTEQLVTFTRTWIEARQAMKRSAVPLLPLELAIIQLTEGRGASSALHSPPVPPPPVQSAPRVEEAIDRVEPTPMDVLREMPSPTEVDLVEPVPSVAPASLVPANPDQWRVVLDQVKPANVSLYSLLQQATFGGVHDQRLRISFPFKFAIDRVNDKKYRMILDPIIADVFGAQLPLDCQVSGHHHHFAQPAAEPTAAPDPALADAVAELFGVEEAPAS